MKLRAVLGFFSVLSPATWPPGRAASEIVCKRPQTLPACRILERFPEPSFFPLPIFIFFGHIEQGDA
jgi:hypothetical protein